MLSNPRVRTLNPGEKSSSENVPISVNWYQNQLRVPKAMTGTINPAMMPVKILSDLFPLMMQLCQLIKYMVIGQVKLTRNDGDISFFECLDISILSSIHIYKFPRQPIVFIPLRIPGFFEFFHPPCIGLPAKLPTFSLMLRHSLYIFSEHTRALLIGTLTMKGNSILV